VKTISENSAVILEAGFPVASLAFANLIIVNQANLPKSKKGYNRKNNLLFLQTGSDEYRALMKLSDSMDRQFRQISRSQTYSYNVINLSLLWRRYMEVSLFYNLYVAFENEFLKHLSDKINENGNCIKAHFQTFE
jgi:replication-associated recombination protein RarA